MRCAVGQQETGVSQGPFHRAPIARMRKTEETLVCSILEAKQIKQDYMWVYVCVCAGVYVCICMCIVCTCVCM